MNHQINRSYYQLSTSNILSKKRVPSLTPPKNYPQSNSKDKITNQVKDKSSNYHLKEGGLNLPIQNALFLQQQNTILSTRKATINLSESSDKLRKKTPNEKSPNNPRLSTMQKNKQISISQSQQTIAQVLAKMQENSNISYINKQLYSYKQNKYQIKTQLFDKKYFPYNQQSLINQKYLYFLLQLYQIPEIESTQKSTINSREHTNSSKHKTEDYQKVYKENLILQKKVCKLEQKILELQQVNQQLLNLANLCDCHQSQLKEIEIKINKSYQNQEVINTQQIQIYDPQNLQQREEAQNKRQSKCQEYLEIKPKNIIDNQNSKNIIKEIFEEYESNMQELKVFKGLTNFMRQTNSPIPSVLKTLSLVINI